MVYMVKLPNGYVLDEGPGGTPVKAHVNATIRSKIELIGIGWIDP